MSVLVFVGPTLSGEETLRCCPGATLAPPIAVGELYALALRRQRPQRVLLIDGYFERMAAVWHKEILFALERGICVYGAASMGALRAAELAPMGMIGIGAIYRDFAAGRLNDDDEVAVAHLPQNHGYASMSEALVNIRATVERAIAKRVLSKRNAAALVVAAQQLHYRDRTWPALLANAPQKFSRWVVQHAVNRKADDARLALAAVRRPVAARERTARARVTAMPATWAMGVLDSLVRAPRPQ